MLQWFGTALIVVMGIIHFLLAPVEYGEARYMGVLFEANFLAAIIAAVGILRGKTWGWVMGLLITAGSLSGYILSRTVGLPGIEIEERFTLIGLVTMAVEGLFILLVLCLPSRPAASYQPLLPAWLRYLLPTAAMLIMVLFSFSTSLWSADTSLPVDNQTASVIELSRLPLISLTKLEQEYGMKVSVVAISAMDSIVDVRLKVIDPEKARLLLDRHAALIVNQRALVLAAHRQAHTVLKPGQIVVMYFPTQNNTVHIGSEVSLVFNDVRVEPVRVK